MATKQEVIFKGLTHSPSDYNCQDGELATCLNLINEDGALKPIQQPVVAEQNITLGGGDTIEFVHKVTHDEVIHSHYIIRKSDDTWYWMEKDGDGAKYTIDLNGFHVNAVTAVGNILCFVGDTAIKYAFWKEDKYIIFSREDLMYSLNITSKNVNEYFVAEMGDDFWNLFHTEKEGSIDEITAVGTQKAFSALDAIVNKYIDENGENLLKYIVFGVAAVRLYDGTYYNVSTPFILAPNTWQTYKGAKTAVSTLYPSLGFAFRLDYNADSEDGKSQFVKTSFALHSHSITIDFPNKTILDLVQGIDIFLTRGDLFLQTNKRYKAYASAMINGKNRYGYCHIDLLSNSEMYNCFDNLSFYHSTFINKNEFGKNKEIAKVLGSEESISLANLNRLDFGGDYAITYNNRLHIANINSGSFKTFEFYPIYTFNLVNSSTKDIASDDRLYIDTYPDLPLENGLYKKDTEKGVMADVVAIVYANDKKYYIYGEMQYPFQPIIAFPIEGGSRAELYIRLDDKYYYYDLTLHSSDTMALSYYLCYGFVLLQRRNISYELGTLGGENQYEGNWKLRILYDYSQSNSSSDDWNKAYQLYLKGFFSKKQPSLIRVSEVENPIIFPAKNSVQVGSSIINALAANTRPISEGQFGDAPLYAFTDEGVWVLMLGEEGTYIARQPANRDICSNPKGILQIDDAVLFPTERGIIIQRGRESESITDVLDDYPFDFISIYSHSTKDKTYPNKLLALGNIPESDVKYVRFRKYLEKAGMIYDYYDNRIIVFNPNYTYAYVYSLKSNMWGTMHNVFNKRVNIYPESYATDKEGKILDVYVKEPVGNVPFFLCSRPLTLGQEVYKTMLDCITRGYFSSIQAGKCGMVLFGSNDLVNWYYISSSVDVFLRSLVGSPYKYFRIALIGKLAPNESISGLSTAFQERLQNKLR